MFSFQKVDADFGSRTNASSCLTRPDWANCAAPVIFTLVMLAFHSPSMCSFSIEVRYVQSRQFRVRYAFSLNVSRQTPTCLLQSSLRAANCVRRKASHGTNAVMKHIVHTNSTSLLFPQ